eukprot:Protomagalhaensia_wolfi_Nauph_80__0@NODE_1000_length_1820_cov_1949_759124_g757_i0_p1_GENE_NODE_1000_length_1820_cov_1949_759124_g757_i0NODE_1000_length_1820_cov_1949_759124_g757_i0_p1_ORF_typecomplete_len434_score97_15HOOK/PF05622_12/1_1e19MAD/PF05557_13/0_0019EzrA/PF06160_12/0_0021EzrA/PF06160_12/6Taxilin/PF09728_9/0_00056Taxilin/PF09728_9/66Myosin_tail_1/PF01576_19/0_0012AAA_13/PF13166_6/0_00088AAA_13/PF13166_6/3_5e02MAP70/PF07058_11/0_00099MAP70/PF07058_11/1_8e03PspA_IM30/PF04012_12/43PspA_IM
MEDSARLPTEEDSARFPTEDSAQPEDSSRLPALDLSTVRSSEQSQEYIDSQRSSDGGRYSPSKELAEEYDRKIADLEATISRLESWKKEAVDRAARDRGTIDRKNDEVDNLHNEIADLVKQKEDAGKEMKTLQKQHDLEIKRLKEDLAEMEELKGRYSSTAKQLERYKAAIEDMGDLKEENERLRYDLNERMQQQVELDRAQESIEEWKQEIEKMRTALAQQAAEKMAAEAENSVIKQELHDVQQRAQQLERDNNALSLQMSLQPQAKSAGITGVTLQGSDLVTDLRGQILRLEKQLEVYQNSSGKSVLQLEQELDVAKRTQEALQSKIQEMMLKGASSVPNKVSPEQLLLQHEVYSRIIHRLGLALKTREASCQCGQKNQLICLASVQETIYCRQVSRLQLLPWLLKCVYVVVLTGRPCVSFVCSNFERLNN